MGLDMYLNKRTYVGANYNHNKVEGEITLTKGEEKKVIPIRLKRVSEITEQVGYWRKANHIHNWFVQNIQNGNDDCGSYSLQLKDVNSLLETCKKVLADRSLASELLPCKSGFFFGGTDQDEWYFKDIEETVKILEEILSENESSEYLNEDYLYTSSW